MMLFILILLGVLLFLLAFVPGIEYFDLGEYFKEKRLYYRICKLTKQGLLVWDYEGASDWYTYEIGDIIYHYKASYKDLDLKFKRQGILHWCEASEVKVKIGNHTETVYGSCYRLTKLIDNKIHKPIRIKQVDDKLYKDILKQLKGS